MHIQQWFSLQDIFNTDELNEITQLCSRLPTQSASVINSGISFKNYLSRNCKSGWIMHDPETNWVYSRLLAKAVEVNDRTFKFEIDDIEPLQYLEYGPLQFYTKHVDNGDNHVATRKLTMVVQLSEPTDYLGGSLSIDSMAYARHAPRERGSVAIFPSHLPHKANPVWIGKRKVLVAWIRGKKPLS